MHQTLSKITDKIHGSVELEVPAEDEPESDSHDSHDSVDEEIKQIEGAIENSASELEVNANSGAVTPRNELTNLPPDLRMFFIDDEEFNKASAWLYWVDG